MAPTSRYNYNVMYIVKERFAIKNKMADPSRCESSAVFAEPIDVNVSYNQRLYYQFVNLRKNGRFGKKFNLNSYFPHKKITHFSRELHVCHN